MTARLTLSFFAVLVGWVLCHLLRLMTEPDVAALLGIVLGLFLTFGLKDSPVVRGPVAVLEPLGPVLPLLALWKMVGMVHPGTAAALGGFSTVELSGILIVYMAFLAASMGALPYHPYRFGYRAVPVAVMVLTICAYAWLTGNAALAIIAVAGQLTWVLRAGSSNWFDHVLHAFLVPVLVIVLLQRLASLVLG